MAFHALSLDSRLGILRAWAAVAFVLGIGLSLPALTQAAAVKDAISLDEIQRLELFAGDVMSCAFIPGMAIGVVRGNATFATGLGLADMHTGLPAGRSTTFNMGSTAKAFVPYILAQILDSDYNTGGRITFDSTLGDFRDLLGDLEVPEDWEDLTLMDMLLYESRSSSDPDLGTMAGLPFEVTREELIKRLRFLPKTKEFKASNHYSNYIYTVVGHLAERLTAKSWMELVIEFVLDKHGMDFTTFAPDGMTLEDVALPYRYQASRMDEPWVGQNSSLFEMYPFEPAGLIMAPAVDVIKWIRDLLHLLDGKGTNSGNSVNQLFRHWIAVPENHPNPEHLHHESQKTSGYGMGWESSTYRGFRRYKYSGHLYAYSSQIWLFPQVLTAVFVSVNGPNSEQAERAIDGIMFHASDLILRQKPWVSSDIACCCEEDHQYVDYPEDAPPVSQTVVKYLIPAQAYEGVYGNGLVGNLQIQTNVAGVLEMRLGRNVFGELIQTDVENKLKFVAKLPLINTRAWEEEKEVQFFPSSGGQFSAVRLHLEGGLFYDFQKGKLFESMLYMPDVVETTTEAATTTQTTSTESTTTTTATTTTTTTATTTTEALPVTEETTRHVLITSETPKIDSTIRDGKETGHENTTATRNENVPRDKDNRSVDNDENIDNKDSLQRDADEKSRREEHYSVEKEPDLAKSAQGKGHREDFSADGFYAQVDETTTECFLGNAARVYHVGVGTLFSLLICVLLGSAWLS